MSPWPVTGVVGRPCCCASIGQYVRRLAGCAVDDAPATLFSRFGRDLAGAWQAHLGYNMSQLTEKDQLAAMGVYAPYERSSLMGLIDWGCASFGPVPFTDLCVLIRAHDGTQRFR